MNIKKFFAKNSREALKQIKDALGGDAVILSNRKVDEGVELLAVANIEVQALVSEATPSPTTFRPGRPEQATRLPVASSSGESMTSKPEVSPVNWQALAEAETVEPGSTLENGSNEIARQVISEIRSMRGAIESQLYGLVWSDLHQRDPARAYLLRDLLTSGFSPALARNLVGRAPAGSPSELNRWAKAALANNLATSSVDEIVNRGGVYALTGPTGVGKTTTTAKLAARCVVRHGADKVALLTTDSYRVGAFEHLKIYSRILGVSVQATRDQQDLKSALTSLRGKHVVLIDTIGMSQRDKQVAEQAAMLSDAGGVQRLLLINATCTGDTLEDVVGVYGGPDLAGVILTKVDEAASIGAALDLIIRHKLKLHFVANGQRVPEDLHPVNCDYLVGRALRSAEASLNGTGGAEMAALMAGAHASTAV